MRKKRSTLKQANRDALLFMAPLALFSLLFFIFPFFMTLLLSFKKYSLLDGNLLTQGEWVGIENYLRIVSDSSFRKALVNTFRFAFLNVWQVPLAFLLALLVDGFTGRFKTVLKAALYIPNITASVAVTVIFMFIFKIDGVGNQLLSLLGVEPVNWYTDQRLALPLVAVMSIWAGCGFLMIVFVSAIQGIPASLFEAGEIDGAGKVRKTFSIVIPVLRPVFLFAFLANIIGSFQLFDQVFVISKGTGGPLDSTLTAVLYIYNSGFISSRLGYASAGAFVLLLIILVFSIIQKKLLEEPE